MKCTRILQSSLCVFLGCLLALIPLNSGRSDSETRSQPWIRVAITTGVSSLTISASGASLLHESESSERIAEFQSNHTYAFEKSGDSVRLTGSGGRICSGFSVVCSDDSGRLQVNGRSYRRMMRVVVWNGSLACINVLPIEEYLWSVVPCEVPYEWPDECLKAQAVAARTYSLRALEQYPDRPFDVYASVTDQAYDGVGWERESTTEACEATSGEICAYNGTPIVAYYHAASGGWTASGEEMFGRDLPYLRAVPSRDSDVHRWVYRISTDNLGAALRRAGYSVGNIQRVWVHRFSDEGRAEEVKIVHSTGVLLLGGADVRNALGPGNIQSTYFTVEGQDTPEIPDEIPDSIYDFGSTGISLEKYALVNSCVLVPFPKPVQLSCCRVISGRGLSDGTSLAALGADGITRYTSGYIWVSEPERAGELGGALPQPQVDPGGFPFFPAEGTQVVEDPGSNVGTPVDGAFVFVGTGMGHGVGMSQHGARLLAQSGWTYTQILRYFYTGIEIVSSW